MNKLVFDLGLLAFCIAAVFYSTEGYEPLDVIARAFLVFVLVELAFGAMLVIAASFSGPKHNEEESGVRTGRTGGEQS